MMNLDALSEIGSNHLYFKMTKREYQPSEIIEEIETCKDPYARGYARAISRSKMKILECARRE